MVDGIPKEIIEELKLKEKKKEDIQEESKIIIEKHQTTIKVPRKIRNELNLAEGSIKCNIILKDKKTMIVEVKNESLPDANRA